MLGCGALFSLRADFSFWLGATSCRVVHARLGSGERMTNTMTDRQRREFLQLAVGGALAASLAPSHSTPVAAEPLGQPVPFAADTVLKMAIELASKPFKAPEAPPLPSVFSGLTFEQYAAIRRVPGTAIWSDQKLGFSLEPLHRGFVYTTPIGINIVENGMAEKVIYDAANFDFGPLKPPASTRRPWLFRLAHSQVLGPRLRRRGDLPGRDLLPRESATPSPSASPHAALQFGPATTRAKNFRCSASSGSKSPIRRRIRSPSRPCSIPRASPAPFASRSVLRTPPSSTPR